MKKVIFMLGIFGLLGCNASQGQNSFIEPEPSDWVEWIKPVREYMYYRTQAVLQNDVQVLWDRYPLLESSSSRQNGVNTEKYEVESLNDSFKLIDANFSEEGYERIKVKQLSDQEAVILVHGGIGYLRDDFEESGGEILIELYVEEKDHHWTVVKTDEYTLEEYKEWIKGRIP
ncbi:hypothetical protein [Ammoniphilus resinae]|uniref:Uncharacterized protein n=1 Tax=Ammoniphilus resinae TaxID=861532 RepID=A0ABS4GWJ1_9BACL|nr:hypothetical protein [Ammoniphilus resinae]MBP1934225.1 hypothetical protein [Ammoniphilus resinae]